MPLNEPFYFIRSTHPCFLSPQVSKEALSVMVSEIKHVLQLMKSIKALGKDGIRTELFGSAGQQL